MCKHLCNCAYCVGDNMDEKSFSNLWLQVVVNRNQLTLSSRCIYSFQVYFPHFSGIQQTLLLWNIFPVLNPESKILCIPSIFPNTHRGKFHSPPQNKQTKNFCSNLLPLSVFFLISDSIWKDIGEKKFCQHLKHGSPGKDIYIYQCLQFLGITVLRQRSENKECTNNLPPFFIIFPFIG